MVKCPDLLPPSGGDDRPIYLPFPLISLLGAVEGWRERGRGRVGGEVVSDENKQLKAGDLKQISVIKTVAKSSFSIFY